MQFLVVGLSHRTAPVASRERFALLAARGAELARTAARRARIAETLVLATCNRVELYGVMAKPGVGHDALIDALGEVAGAEPDRGEWYIRTGEAAVAHLFRVAAGLDAMAIGETQVLAQLKMAYQRAWEAGTTGPILNRTLHRAFFVAKRVHTEEPLNAEPLSMASIAAAHAAELVGDAGRARAIVVGAGETGTAAARQLVREGFAEVAIAGRNGARVQAAAIAAGAEALAWTNLFARIRDVDVVVAATSAKRPIISGRQVKPGSLAGRKHPLTIIDLGTPRNVAPALRGATGVNLVTIDDLKPVAEANRTRRLHAARQAEAIVEEEARRFGGELEGRRFATTVAALATKLEAIRARECTRLFKAKPGFSPEQRAAIETAAAAIVARVLCDPACHLKDEALGDEERFMSADVLRRIFKL